MSNTSNIPNTTATRAIPSAGPDLEHLLAQDVVIEAGSAAAETGAQREAPDHSPRAPQAGALAQGRAVPTAGLLTASAD